MAPRGRPKKKSNTRKAAAFDAMRQYGFHDDVIEKTVKELLNVYGEEGWVFIEDSAYKVLLEAILEKVVKETEEGTSDSKKPDGETSGGTALELACSDVNPLDTECQISNGLDCAPEALCTLKLTNESEDEHLALIDTEGSIKSDDQNPYSTSHFTAPSSHNSPQQQGYSKAKSPPPPPPLPTSPPPLQGNSTARRRPYYGWYHSDDEEDLVELTPGPLAIEMENYLSSFMEHKRRWDIKPDDM